MIWRPVLLSSVIGGCCRIPILCSRNTNSTAKYVHILHSVPVPFCTDDSEAFYKETKLTSFFFNVAVEDQL